MNHIINATVENQPGVLSRIVGLFSGRGYNIETLNVGPCADPMLSRMTLTLPGDEKVLEQVTKQLNKLVNVIKIVELEDDYSVQRQLLLVKVAATDANRSNVLQVVDLFRAHVVDMVPDAVTIETTGGDNKVRAFLTALEPYGIKEIVRSGAVAIGRGNRSLSERVSAEMQLRRA